MSVTDDESWSTTILVLKYPPTLLVLLMDDTILWVKSKLLWPAVKVTASPTAKGEPVPSGKSIVVVVPVVIPTTLCAAGKPIAISDASVLET